MANKGIHFDGPGDPRIPAGVRRKLHGPALDAWIEQHNAEFAIVGTCDLCDPPHPLIAREVEPHRLKHEASSGRARQIIGLLQHTKTSDADRAEVRAFLDAAQGR